jgi:hypothetical protein
VPIDRRRRLVRVVSRKALVEGNAAKAGGTSEANPTSAPLAVGGGQIFGHEHHLGRPADEAGLRRIRSGLNERQDRCAVGRGDRQQPLTRLHAGIERDAKSQRVQVEPEASLLVFHVDVDRVHPHEGIRRRVADHRFHQPDYRDTAWTMRIALTPKAALADAPIDQRWE